MESPEVECSHSEELETFYTPPESRSTSTSTSTSLEDCNDDDNIGESHAVNRAASLGKTLGLGFVDVNSTQRNAEEDSEKILKSLKRWKLSVDMLSSTASSELGFENRFEVGEGSAGKRKLDSLVETTAEAIRDDFSWVKVLCKEKTAKESPGSYFRPSDDDFSFDSCFDSDWQNPSSVDVMLCHPQSPKDEQTNYSKCKSISIPTEGYCVVNMIDYEFFNELDTDTIGADNANIWSCSSWANGTNKNNPDHGNNKVQGSCSKGKRVLPSWANEPVKVNKRKLVQIPLPDSQANERVGIVEKVKVNENESIQVHNSKASDHGGIDLLNILKGLGKECDKDRDLECLSLLEVAKQQGWFM